MYVLHPTGSRGDPSTRVISCPVVTKSRRIFLGRTSRFLVILQLFPGQVVQSATTVVQLRLQ